MPDDTDYSSFAQKFSIPSRETDPLKWNEEWEKILPTLSASEDVYPVMRSRWDRESWDPVRFSAVSVGLRARLCECQEALVRSWSAIEETSKHFITAWPCVGEGERRRHLMKGLQDGCDKSSCGSDSRALCPEITLDLMLQRRGNAFIDCIRNYRDGAKDVGTDTAYLLPSEWWQKAVDTSQASPEEVETFNLLTIQRNEFIVWFLLHTIKSILQHFSFGSPGTDLVSINNVGFGTPHPSRPHSPALQRQVSLLTDNKEIDYYLFDELDLPIPVELPDMWTKLSFRVFRSQAMFNAEQRGTEAIAEQLIKVMGHVPGLSRERILDQLSREYGGDMAAKMAEFERIRVRKGYAPGTTFLEGVAKGLPSIPMQV